MEKANKTQLQKDGLSEQDKKHLNKLDVNKREKIISNQIITK